MSFERADCRRHVRGDALVARLVLDDGAADARLCRARLLEDPGPAQPRGQSQPRCPSAVPAARNLDGGRAVRCGERVGGRVSTARAADCGSGKLVGLTFRLDRQAADNLFPRSALSLNAPIGLALWILALHGMTQTSVTLFLPLLLQVVHRLSPVVINFLSIVISMGWTTATFTVSGWSGKRERLALASGPVSPRWGSPR